jgi:hypothetical protein
VGAPLKYKSETKPWISGSNTRQQFQTSAIAKRGPNGGRVVIDKIIAHFQGDVTVATAALKGEDFYRFMRLLSVKQRDGEYRLNEVPGDALRVALYELVGGAMTKEHSDSATTANQTLTATVLIPMEKPHMHTPDDYSLPADQLEFVEIGCAIGTEMALNGNTVTINSGNYWLIFECHEEMDVVHHCVDEIKTQDFESSTSQEVRLNVHGRLQDLLLFVRGNAGGASLANLTSIGISQPQNMAPTDLLANPDLKEFYARSRNAVTGLSTTTGAAVRSDPFVASTTRACAVLMTNDTSSFEQPETDTVVVKSVHTLGATPTCIMRIAKPRKAATAKAIAKKYGLSGRFRIKTASKTRRYPRAWAKELWPYLSIKFDDTDPSYPSVHDAE